MCSKCPVSSNGPLGFSQNMKTRIHVCLFSLRQSDVVHQSVYELIHTDDRALFRQQLHFSLNPPDNGADCMTFT